MNAIKTGTWTLAIALTLSACSKEKPVTIQPGAFTQEWPTALRGEINNTQGCIVDRINGKSPYDQALTFKSGETLTMNGWTFSKNEGTPSDVYIQLVSPTMTYTALTQKRTSRADVSNAYKLSNEMTPGFELIATQKIEPGEYHIEVLQAGKRSVSQCEAKVSITIN